VHVSIQQGASRRRQLWVLSRIASSGRKTEGGPYQGQSSRERHPNHWQEERKSKRSQILSLLFSFSRISQKQTKWALPNKGVEGRAARDLEHEVLERRTVESTRAALERKAKIYEKLKKGRSGGLSEAQYDALLVDVSSPHPFNRGTTVTGGVVRLQAG
jgi:hypothetical protein